MATLIGLSAGAQGRAALRRRAASCAPPSGPNGCRPQALDYRGDRRLLRGAVDGRARIPALRLPVCRAGRSVARHPQRRRERGQRDRCGQGRSAHPTGTIRAEDYFLDVPGDVRPSVATFAVSWESTGNGILVQFALIAAFSNVGGRIPAAVTSYSVRIAPADGSVTAVLGLTQQIFNVGNFLGPCCSPSSPREPEAGAPRGG